jgi:hypothetical protein
LDSEDFLLLGGGVIAAAILFPDLFSKLGKSVGGALSDAIAGFVEGFTAPFVQAGANAADQTKSFVAQQTQPQNLLNVNYGTPSSRTLQFNPWNIFKPFSVQYVDPVTHQQRWV